MPRLCIGRREGERIRIGPDIWVEVVGVGGSGRRRKARLVITAPAEVAIWREELIATVEGRAAANGTSHAKE